MIHSRRSPSGPCSRPWATTWPRLEDFSAPGKPRGHGGVPFAGPASLASRLPGRPKRNPRNCEYILLAWWANRHDRGFSLLGAAVGLQLMCTGAETGPSLVRFLSLGPALAFLRFGVGRCQTRYDAPPIHAHDATRQPSNLPGTGSFPRTFRGSSSSPSPVTPGFALRFGPPSFTLQPFSWRSATAPKTSSISFGLRTQRRGFPACAATQPVTEVPNLWDTHSDTLMALSTQADNV